VAGFGRKKEAVVDDSLACKSYWPSWSNHVEATMNLAIDAHQHFWRYKSYQTSWMEQAPYAGDNAFEAIRRDFGADELVAEMDAAGVAACVTVEAADHPGENAALLATARRCPRIAGVVGWVPLEDAHRTSAALDAVSHESRFVGVRHLINIEPDPDWILRPAVIDGLRQVAERGLAFDYVGILPAHLANVPRLAEAVPGLRIVIDHLGKPPVDDAGFETWAALLAEAARAPGVVAKISGLDVGAGDHWRVDDLRPSIDHALTHFGPERLMLGSDWPVALLRGGYQKVWTAMNAAIEGLPPASRQWIRGGTAIKTYRLKLRALEERADRRRTSVSAGGIHFVCLPWYLMMRFTAGAYQYVSVSLRSPLTEPTRDLSLFQPKTSILKASSSPAGTLTVSNAATLQPLEIVPK
jgi:L-fuconolactonase